MIPEQFVFIGFLLSFLGILTYAKNIIWGNVRPNLISWSLWMLAPFIGVFLQWKAGAGLSMVPVFMAGFGPVIVIITSLIKRSGFWKLTSFDLLCGFFSLTALSLYVLFHNLNISIIFAILSDALAFIPTFKKSWINPESESLHGYFWCIIGNTIGILVIKDWSFVIASFGIYMIIFNIAEVAILYRKKITSIFF